MAINRKFWNLYLTSTYLYCQTNQLVQQHISRYWPKEGIVSYGQFEICVVSKHAVCPHYLVRSFYIKDRISGSSRTLTQFQYKSWNDVNNTPANLPSFLEFRRKVSELCVYLSVVRMAVCLIYYLAVFLHFGGGPSLLCVLCHIIIFFTDSEE